MCFRRAFWEAHFDTLDARTFGILSRAEVALSDKPWLAYLFQGAYQCVPLSYETLEYASSFASEQCPEGLVAIAQNTLRILAIERLGEVRWSCRSSQVY